MNAVPTRMKHHNMVLTKFLRQEARAMKCTVDAVNVVPTKIIAALLKAVVICLYKNMFV